MKQCDASMYLQLMLIICITAPVYFRVIKTHKPLNQAVCCLAPTCVVLPTMCGVSPTICVVLPTNVVLPPRVSSCPLCCLAPPHVLPCPLCVVLPSMCVVLRTMCVVFPRYSFGHYDIEGFSCKHAP